MLVVFWDGKDSGFGISSKKFFAFFIENERKKRPTGTF
jgi:hypothetical protein